MWLFVLFLTVPLVEIALFIQVGGWIGLWPTLAVVVLTAIIGTYLVRKQGIAAVSRLRASLNELRDPTEALVHGALILVAGVLLLTPGFFTDAVGFLLLVPAVRVASYRWLRTRVRVREFSYGTADKPDDMPQPDVIDGEFVELPDEQRATHQPSGWTRH